MLPMATDVHRCTMSADTHWVSALRDAKLLPYGVMSRGGCFDFPAHFATWNHPHVAGRRAAFSYVDLLPII